MLSFALVGCLELMLQTEKKMTWLTAQLEKTAKAAYGENITVLQLQTGLIIFCFSSRLRNLFERVNPKDPLIPAFLSVHFVCLALGKLGGNTFYSILTAEIGSASPTYKWSSYMHDSGGWYLLLPEVLCTLKVGVTCQGSLCTSWKAKKNVLLSFE